MSALDICPVCQQDHSGASVDTEECDYEECVACGFDHEYEPAEAKAAHEMLGFEEGIL